MSQLQQSVLILKSINGPDNDLLTDENYKDW